jgi:hypothetical protein
MPRLIVAFVVAFALVPITTGSAEEPPPEPFGTLTLTETSPGAYQLAFHGVSDRSPYIVEYRNFQIGTDQGMVGQLAEEDNPDFVVDLQLPLDGMNREACYHVTFSVRPKSDDEPFDSASIETRGCLDGAGNTTFPANDGVIAPPPPPPSDVRVVARYDYWAIEWTDNSTDELSFLPRIIFLDRPWADGGSQISTLTLPEVPANQTAAYALGTGTFFFPEEPAEPMCAYAMVLVFAIGPDSPSVWPGNTTVPACFGGRTLSFPGTGTGDVRAEGVRPFPVLVVAVGFGAAGVALTVCGWAHRPVHCRDARRGRSLQ